MDIKQTVALQKAFNSEINEAQKHHPSMSRDGAFVHWFFVSYLAGRDDLVKDAITGGSRDKGADGIFVDDNAEAVHIVQAKYRETFMKKSEKKGDVLALVDFVRGGFHKDEREYQVFSEGLNTSTASLLENARSRVMERKYRVKLYYVTTGKLSKSVRDDVLRDVDSLDASSTIELIDGERLLSIYRDYLAGVAPPIASLKMKIDDVSNVTVSSVHQRNDPDNKIESWVVSMRGDAVADLYQKAGNRIFARNIRGYLGGVTDINKSMVDTLRHEPDRFYYYNNGVTMVCDGATHVRQNGQAYLELHNPQIINGQQTTRTLAAHKELAAKASVMMKILSIKRDGVSDSERFDKLVSHIVSGTNWQNPIDVADLRSNTPVLVDLQRHLRRYGYYFLRRRESARETAREVGKHYVIIKKDEMAKAIAGCELDPTVARSGAKKLFGEDNFDRIFPNSDPHYYLPRYGAYCAVKWETGAYATGGYAKWVVLNFIWRRIKPILVSNRMKANFLKMWDADEHDVYTELSPGIQAAFAECEKYYNQNKGAGMDALEPSLFFRSKKGRDKEFETHWRAKASNANKRRLDKALSGLEKAMKTG